MKPCCSHLCKHTRDCVKRRRVRPLLYATYLGIVLIGAGWLWLLTKVAKSF